MKTVLAGLVAVALNAAAAWAQLAAGAIFTDVDPHSWTAAWIEWLAVDGITTGCAPGKYCPDSSVSRDQMAAFLARTFALP